MLSRRFLINCLLGPIICGVLLASCQSSPEKVSSKTSQGILTIRANGEDFIRQGFTSKDGWHLDFKRVAVNLGAVTAYQTAPSFDPEGSQPLRAKQQVSLEDTQPVDLAAGDRTAETKTILVGTIPAPPGHYNALSWQLLKDAAGYSLVLQGLAQKGAQQIPFTLKLDRNVAFVCGDYVGEERKGLLTSAGQADLEATFHFDHLFGDGSLSSEDELNRGALGFGPLAQLATQNRLEITASELARQLPPEEAQKLETLWLSLGHVGEGHCQAKYL
ncbi:DUF4382 domain-containing protein [Synechocystis sp. LKSZ1]|uniref:DUF4382 domain-containing protein n=1 Tax=Synechocystis sp. LKSZ1 TaxID=3144951 RepID=UPI00336BF9B6